MTKTVFTIRDPNEADISTLPVFMLEHGANDWNHLPAAEILEHIERIRMGNVRAVIADLLGEVIGVVTYEIGRRYPKYQPPGRENESHGYIAEAVTHRSYVRKGIGTQLFGTAIQRLADEGIREIYSMHHEENTPSHRMMERNGMQIVDTFDDPDIRPTGTRRTTVERIIIEEPTTRIAL